MPELVGCIKFWMLGTLCWACWYGSGEACGVAYDCWGYADGFIESAGGTLFGDDEAAAGCEDCTGAPDSPALDGRLAVEEKAVPVLECVGVMGVVVCVVSLMGDEGESRSREPESFVRFFLRKPRVGIKAAEGAAECAAATPLGAAAVALSGCAEMRAECCCGGDQRRDWERYGRSLGAIAAAGAGAEGIGGSR
jgi:hypothetical protein